MKKIILTLVVLCVFAANLLAQADSAACQSHGFKHRSYEARQAFEVESLVPMFLTGGFHFGLSYRFDRFRVRVSVINGGDYDAEPAGLKNSSPDFKRYYKTSPGLFLGYNVWRNLELYTYLESHTFEIEQVSSGLRKDIHSTDVGGGVSYPFFVGPHFYLQPGLHLYLRGDKSADFNGVKYEIPNVDFAPVFRVGYRIWSKY
jgi:hypothetical protein